MIITKKELKIFSLVGILLFSFLSPLSASAIDKSFYSSSDILFYDPTATNACASSTSVAPTGSISLEKSDALQHIFQTLIDNGMSAVQASAIMGNLYQESKFNTNSLNTDGSNSYGLAQWLGNRRTRLEAYAATQGKPASDIDVQLGYLLKEYNESYKARLDKSDFATSSDVAAATMAWMKIFEGPLMKPDNDPGRVNSVRIPAAEKIYGFYSSLKPSAGSSSSSSTTASTNSGCSASGNVVVSGSIVKTAIGLAQPQPVNNGTTSLSQSTTAFQTAKAQFDSAPDPTDCGGFVATVMKSSGVDSNYPNVGTSVQYNYVQTNSQKYTVIHPKTMADLQPGDILITAAAGHTIIYVGAEGGKYPAVDASLGQRIPSMREAGGVQYMLAKSDIIAARIIK